MVRRAGSAQEITLFGKMVKAEKDTTADEMSKGFIESNCGEDAAQF